MKKLPLLILLLIVAGACKLDPIEDAWEYYEDWRNDNNQWLAEQETRVDADGNPYYEKVVPVYDNNAYVLIHYFNDRNLTADNLSPLATSVVDVKYHMELYDGTAIDSTYLRTEPADSLARFDLSNANYIAGFRIALMAMHVGDSCDVIIPYQQGYTNMGDSYGKVAPYSHLRYRMKLANIAGYEINPVE